VYDGTEDGAAEHVEMTVTRSSRTVVGVPCVVIQDVATSNGTLVEETTGRYAQDGSGNVWYFGEDSEDSRPRSCSSTRAGACRPGAPPVDAGAVLDRITGEFEAAAPGRVVRAPP
jgi:hypothetical protein